MGFEYLRGVSVSAGIRPFSDQGHYTGVHNVVFDILMPRLSDTAFKVLCLIIRKTKGHDKRSDEIPYSAFFVGTGIKSSATVSKALKELLESEYILKKADGSKFGAARYALNRRWEVPVEWIVDADSIALENEERSLNSKASSLENEASLENEDALENEAVPLQNLKHHKKESNTFTNVQVSSPQEKKIPEKVSKKNQRESPYSWGALIPLENDVHAALVTSLHVKTSSTEKKKRAVEELARDFIADGRTVEQIAQVVSKYWANKFKRAYFGEAPTPEVMRDHFDEILNLPEKKNDQPKPASAAERAADKLNSHRADLARRAATVFGGGDVAEDRESLSVVADGDSGLAGADGVRLVR